MPKRLLALFAVLAFAAPGPGFPQSVAAETAGPTLTAKVDAIVDEATERGFAGGVAIMKDGALIYDRVAGYSDSAKAAPVTEETLFHVASITKYLTAALVMKAAEEDLLSLDAPVSDYLPEMAFAKRGATISDLLAHRSGLGSSYAAEKHADAAGAIAAIDAVPFDESKVGQFKYSNDGYDLLAIILERVCKKPYEDAARNLLLEPARLSGTGFWGETNTSDPRRVGQPLEVLPETLRARNYGMIGSAGYLTTARDLARLEAALADGETLSAASYEALHAPRGEISIGSATYGAFLMRNEALGPYYSARGFEDWGDNAILNHYLDSNVIIAVVTSKGPAEGEGKPFRDTISKAIEDELAAQ